MTNYECTKEKECPTCQKQGIIADCEPDSSNQAWDYYEHVYKDEYGKSDFAGDTMFNFKYIEKKGRNWPGKYQSFENIISNSAFDDEEKTELLDQLKRCAKNHHSLLNFSLMPSTGGLNSSKGGIFDKLDRFDTFISFLDQFYKSSRQHIYTHALLNPPVIKMGYANIKILKNYLKSYDTVENYCKKMYFISDNNFINRLIANGCNPIQYTQEALKILSEQEQEQEKQDNIKTLKDYMTLAEAYWAMRHDQLQENLCHSSRQGNCGCNCNHYYYTDRLGVSESYCYHDKCKVS